MSATGDIGVIEAYIKSLFPAATTGKQVVPEQPPANSFYVRLLREDRDTETRWHYRIDRTYQIVHITTRPDTAIADMDTLSTAIYQNELIGHLRIHSFSVSDPMLTENQLYANIGVLSTSIRESRIQTVYPKINNVNVRKV